VDAVLDELAGALDDEVEALVLVPSVLVQPTATAVNSSAHARRGRRRRMVVRG
jgi:hypothetical protein